MVLRLIRQADRNRQHGIAPGFDIQAALFILHKRVLSGLRDRLCVEAAALLVRGRKHDGTVECLDRPTRLDEATSKPVEHGWRPSPSVPKLLQEATKPRPK